jgi:hypothetical protein
MPIRALHELPLERQCRLARGLCLLLEAFEDAKELDYDAWQFAVRLEELHGAGLNSGDVRWLITRKFVLHALEQTSFDSAQRRFVPAHNLNLCESSSLVLTENNSQAVRAWCEPIFSGSEAEKCLGSGEVPRWDSGRRELSKSGLVVKKFRVPAPNQETILSAFEEEGWPPRIDDPLPAAAGFDPDQRLHDAVRGLNRNQQHRLIQFLRDGKAEGVCWIGLAAVGT